MGDRAPACAAEKEGLWGHKGKGTETGSGQGEEGGLHRLRWLIESNTGLSAPRWCTILFGDGKDPIPGPFLLW